MKDEKQHSFWKQAQEFYRSCSLSPPRGPGGSASRQRAEEEGREEGEEDKQRGMRGQEEGPSQERGWRVGGGEKW